MRGEPRVRIWLTPQEVGLMVGFSAQFIRGEIKLKVLPAQWVPSRAGKLGRYRIHRDDAIAYAIKMGTWKGATT